MKKMLFALLACFLHQSSPAQFDTNKKDYKKYTGLFDFYYDEGNGKVFLEVDALEKEFLYVYALSSGLGSNDIGLDRGQLGNGQVVYFKKAGNKLLLVQPNLKFRALTENALEKESVEQAFAKSIIGTFPIQTVQNGTYIVDVSDFLIRDAHGVADRLKKADQGTYSLTKDKSFLDLDRTRAFPRNVEFDAVLTFTGEPKGDWIRSVAPNAGLITVSQHHSFIALPEDGYEKRAFDPRSGSFPFSYYDYSTPVQEPILKRFINRHRLKKKNPDAEMSEAVEPIIYYLDNGTPEPVRSALMEGGQWWNQAFEAIGYKDAFQLKILPDDVDPLDVRYNVIQWVHRSTRGWSYGRSITDPRTGEIIKGMVSLGSLRIRQDFLIAQALMTRPFEERDDNHQEMLDLALARIRQLSAHEIGHTLGFAHNYAASTNDRASVMDYPHPKFSIMDGDIDFSDAYATGIGEWDKVTVAYSYTEFPNGTSEERGLDSILDAARERGLRYITDQDARPAGSSHILAHLWDNGANVSEELERVLELRKTAISNFSRDNIRSGEPYTVLEDVFVPLYFFHRYQTEAVAKVIGGMQYDYNVKGDGQPYASFANGALQQQALIALLKTLNASEMAIPKEKLHLFPPRAFGYPRTRESFKGKTGISFDPISAAETAADMTLGFLLHPERASRLVQQKALDPKNLGLDELLDKVIVNTLGRVHKDPYLFEVQNSINFRVLYHLMNLAASEKVHPAVNALANDRLKSINEDNFGNALDRIDALEMLRRIRNFYEHPDKFKVVPAPKIPDGSPIGMDCFH